MDVSISSGDNLIWVATPPPSVKESLNALDAVKRHFKRNVF